MRQFQPTYCLYGQQSKPASFRIVLSTPQIERMLLRLFCSVAEIPPHFPSHDGATSISALRNYECAIGAGSHRNVCW